MSDSQLDQQDIADIIVGTLEVAPDATLQDVLANWVEWTGRPASPAEQALIAQWYADARRRIALEQPSMSKASGWPTSAANHLVRRVILASGSVLLLVLVVYVEAEASRGYAGQQARLLYFIAPIVVVPPVGVALITLAVRRSGQVLVGSLTVASLALIAYALAIPGQAIVPAPMLMGGLAIGVAVAAATSLGALDSRTWSVTVAGGAITTMLAMLNPALGLVGASGSVAAALAILSPSIKDPLRQDGRTKRLER